MATTRTRWTFRIVLLLMLAGIVSYGGYRAWARSRPEMIWTRAQEFLAVGNGAAAGPMLERLLAKDPTHAWGHLALAQLVLQAARQGQPTATYAGTALADRHLREAVRWARQDQAAALPVLQECIAHDLWARAAELAEVVLRLDPQNADALFAVAAQRVTSRAHSQARPYLEQLAQLPSEPRVRTLTLLAEVAQLEEDSATVRTVAGHALRLAGQGLASLDGRELADLDRLLMLSVHVADSAAAAVERARVALDWRTARVAAGNQPPVAPQAAELAILLVHRWPAVELADGPAYAELWPRLVEAGRPAAAEESAPPEAYRALAAVAAAGGDSALGLSLIEEGIGSLAGRKQVPHAELVRLLLTATRERLAQRQLGKADEHIRILLDQPEHAGLASALAAHVALAEGRHEDALAQLRAAEKRIGPQPIVRGTLAAYHMTQGAWREAAEQLDALQKTLGSGTRADDGRSWVQVTLGGQEVVRLYQIRAWLMLGDDQQVRLHMQALQGTPWEPQAWGAQAGGLWISGRRREASEIVRQARRAFPDDLPLARLAMQFLLEEDRPAEADALAREMARRQPDDAGARLMVVHGMLARHDLTAALSELERLTEAFPGRTGLHLLRIQVLLVAGRAEEALAALETVDHQAVPQGDRDVVAALAALQLGDFSSANRQLQSRDTAARQQGGVVMLAAGAAMLAQDYGYAVDALADAMSYTGLRSRAVASLAEALTTLADQAGCAAAEARLDELLRRYPKEPALWSCRVDLLARTGQWQEALRALDHLQSLPGGSAQADLVRARLQVALGRDDAALEGLRRARSADPANLNVLRLAAAVHLQQGHLQEAARCAEEGLKAVPQSVDLTIIQAQALRRQGQSAAAVEVLETFQKSYPRQAGTYLQLAAWQEEDGQTAAAAETLQRGLQQVPHQPDLLHHALRLACQADPESARSLAQRLAGDANSGEVLARVAGALAAGGAIEAARAWADRAVQAAKEQNRPSALVHAVRGDIAHQQAGRQKNDPALLAEARDEYRRSLELDGAQGGVAFALSSLLAREDANLAEARQVAEAALHRLPLDRVPLNLFELLLDVYLRTGQLSQADALLGKALTIRPMDESWLVAKAELGYRTGRCHETLTELAALESRAGPTAGLCYARARLYEQLEQRQAALAAGEQARKLLPAHVPTRLLLARQYLALQRYDLAQEHAGAALQRDPSSWDAHVLRAEIHQAAGSAELCRKAVEDSLQLLAESLTHEPARPEPYRTAARLHQLAGAPDAALEILERGRRTVPASEVLLAQEVEIHLARGRAEQARRLADEAATGEPSAQLCLLLGQVFQSYGDLTTAELWARRGCERAAPGQLLAARLLLAGVALDRGKKTGDRTFFELAREQYTAVLADFPRHVIAGNNLAWLLMTHLDNPDEALAVAQQVRGPAGPESLHTDFIATLLRVYRLTARWTEGQEIVEAATHAAPDSPSLQLEMGLFHAATNNPAAARDALQQALRAGLDAEQRQEAEHWINMLAAR